MKKIISLLCFMGSVFLVSPAHAYTTEEQELQICSSQVIDHYRSKIDRPEYFDKYKHCTMSCILTLHCGSVEALGVGILKEVQDVFTPGDADIEDLRADKTGIYFAQKRKARSFKGCSYLCNKVYPKI